MKRKSEQVPANVIRNVKKNKTQGFLNKQSSLLNWKVCSQSQVIASKIMHEIASIAEAKINDCAHSQLVDLVMQSCVQLSDNLASFICPEIQEFKVDHIESDVEPSRISYDPICGFDKLIKIKNDSISSQQNQFAESKLRPFGVYQISKKQQSLPKNSVTPLMKLVPLDSLNPNLIKSKSQKENEKQQTFYRQRIYDSALPTITPPQNKKLQKSKNTKLGFDLIKHQSQEYVFDYKGQKCPLTGLSKINGNFTKQSSGNVLRTTYRVLQSLTAKEEKKKMEQSKGRMTRTSNLTQILKVNKEVIKNPNIRHEDKQATENSVMKCMNVGQSEQVKSILEASFRQKEGTFRPIERTHRASKIL